MATNNINKINGSLSHNLTKVNGKSAHLLCTMLKPHGRYAPMFNSFSADLNGSSNSFSLNAFAGSINPAVGTISIWTKFDTDGGDDSCLFEALSDTEPAANNIKIHWDYDEQKLTFVMMYSGEAYTRLSDTLSIDGDGNWHRIGMTWTQVGMIPFIDGVPLEGGEMELPTFAGTCNKVVIGMTNADADYWDGHINEVAIWTAAFNIDMMDQTHNGGVPFNLTRDMDAYNISGDLAGYWKFEENTGTAVTDFGAAEANGALSHSGLFSTDSI